jgi:hypothetical protein
MLPLATSSKEMLRLENLINASNLQMKAETSQNINTRLKASDGYRPSNTNNQINALADQFQMAASIGEIPPEKWTDSNALLILGQIHRTSTNITNLLKDSDNLQMTNCALVWEACRSTLIIHNWLVHSGPLLAESLFDSHWNKNLTSFQLQHPKFGPIVHQTVCYIKQIYYHKTLERPTTKRKKGQQRRDEHVTKQKETESSSNAIRSLRNVTAAFGELYPTSNSANEDRVFLLPEIPAHLISDAQDNQYRNAKTCFLRFIYDTLLVDNLKDIDRFLCPNASTNNADAVRNRHIARGQLLKCVLKAFGDDDGIFATEDWKPILQNPRLLFSSTYDRDDAFGRYVATDPDGAFAGLQTWLNNRTTIPIIQSATAMGDEIWAYFRHMTDTQQSVKMLARHNPYTKLLVTTYASMSHDMNTGQIRNLLSVETLTPHIDSPGYGQLGLLIREALNWQRRLPVGNISIYRIMSGLRPSTGQTRIRNGEDVDQFNPIRFNNEYSRLILKHFHGGIITTKIGISRLLSYMACGHGYMTREFQKNNDMDFTTLKECVALYERASCRGDMYFNQRVWGQPCAHMAIHPVETIVVTDDEEDHHGYRENKKRRKMGAKESTRDLKRTKKITRRLTTNEKFSPFFSSELQNSWIVFLGGLANQDPSESTEPKIEWHNAYSWITSRKLICFQTGLTPFQFCNNLVQLQVCASPPPSTMSRWISKNPRLGAAKGLASLGFEISGPRKGHHWVRAAFMSVYVHLDKHLSAEDKDELRFDTIFVESLLCKVTRFKYSFSTNGKESLQKLGLEAQKAQHNNPWTPTYNAVDTTGQRFPIPLSASLEDIEQVIDQILVSSD